MAANTKGAKLVDSGDEAGEALRSLHAEQHTRASLLDPSAHSGSLDPLQSYVAFSYTKSRRTS